MGILRLFNFSSKRSEPEVYEVVITHEGFSLEGSEELGAYVEDVLRCLEKKADYLGITGEFVVFIRGRERTLGIKRVDDVGIGVISTDIESTERALESIEKKVMELLEDRYEELMKEYRRKSKDFI